MVEPDQVAAPPEPAPVRKRSAFASNVLKLTSGAVVAQVITVLSAPIISRIFGPESFGILTLFVAMVGIVGVLTCMRYELAIMLPERDEDAANLVGVSLSATLLVTGASLLALVFREPLLRLLNAPDLSPYLWMFPLALVVHGVYLAAFYWNTRTKHFARLSFSRVAASLTTSTLPIGLGLLGHAGAAALLATWVAGSTVGTVVSAGPVYWQGRGLFRRSIRLRPMLDNLKRYRKFPLIDAWGGLVNALSWQLPPLMLSAFFTATLVGYYGQSYRVIMLPLSLVGDAIGKVLFQRAAELRRNRQELAHTVSQTFQRLVALGLFPSLLLIVAGRELFMAVLGAQWAEAGVYSQILGPWMFFLFISWPLSNLFFVLERQELALVVNVLILGTRVAALVVGGVSHDIYLTLGLWAGTGVLVYGGLALWSVWIAGVPLRAAGRTLLRYTLYGLPALAVLLPIKIWLRPSEWVLSAIVVGALAVHFLWVLRDDPALRQYLFSLLRARIGAAQQASRR